MDYAKIGEDWRVGDALPEWQWLRETPVAILEENELPAWKNTQQIMDALKEMGAEHIRYPAICWGAHFYAHSAYLPKAAGIAEDSDYFGAVAHACRENGVRLMAYCHYGVLYRELEKLHPDWLARKQDGTPEIWNAIHRKSCLCSKPFQEAMRGAIGEVIEKYHPDSVYLDGPAWYCEDCYCDSCRSRYRAAYGEEMPAQIAWEDGSREKYNRIRDAAYLETLTGIHALTQQAGIPLLINTHMHSTHTRKHGITEENMALHCEGANTTEVHRPGRFMDMFESAKLGEATKRVSMCYCPPGPFETLRTFDLEETVVTGMAYVMHGGTPMLEPLSSYFFDNAGGEKMRELTANIRQHRDAYYRMQPVRDLTLVYPRRALERMHPDTARYLNACFSGVFETLTHAGIHFDCIYDAQLSSQRLKGYRAIMMPASAYMDEEQLQTIREFVREGGALLAGPECTLYDENGAQTGRFALEDVLGVHFEKENAAQPHLAREYRESALLHGYSRVPEAYVTSKEGLCQRLVPVSDAVVGVPDLNRYIRYMHVALQNARALADLYLPADGAFGEPLTFPYGTPPAITENVYGKGRAYYMAAQIGLMYARRGLPEQRNLLVNLVRRALSDKPVLEMHAPPSLIVNLVENARESCLHILNYTGMMLEKSRAIEWIAPLENIGATIRLPHPIKEVRTLYPDAVIPFEQNGGEVRVTLPRLEKYQSIRFLYGEE